MAEYYPLLAKAVGSLPNSTPESRRVVYERARKALIGQLRTLHPPVPDGDIESESVALDRAIERLEAELAQGVPPGVPSGEAAPLEAASPSSATAPPAAPPPATPRSQTPAVTPPPAAPPVGLPAEKTERQLPLRPRPPVRRPGAVETPPSAAPVPVLPPGRPAFLNRTPPARPIEEEEPAGAENPLDAPIADAKRPKPGRADPQRPIAPQPRTGSAQRRRLWIIPVAVGVVMAVVAYFAWSLRDRPETIVRGTPPVEQQQIESGKIAERVGEAGQPPADTGSPPAQATSADKPSTAGQRPQAAQGPANPELPVAHRAALLVEAPDEPNKVKTYLGNVVWKLNNVPQGPNDAVGLAVEADIDLPDDKLSAVVTFAKNTDASLPASHTINVRYTVDPSSPTGNVKQISVPQMRPEASPSGEPLAGVTVQIVPNSFLVGLSPGNAETANTTLMRRLQWIDIPMLLENGKIAKLTFEKGDSGQRDLSDALDAWLKP